MSYLIKMIRNRSRIKLYGKIFVLIGALMLGLITKTSYAKSWENRPSHAEVLKIQDFSCDHMTGFTFKYPIFKGWEIKQHTHVESECCIIFNQAHFKLVSKFIVGKGVGEDYQNLDSLLKENPHGIHSLYYTEFPLIPRKNPYGISYVYVPHENFKTLASFLEENPHGIPFLYYNSLPLMPKKEPYDNWFYVYTQYYSLGRIAIFDTSEFLVVIAFCPDDSVNDEYGFSIDLFFKSIIETFQLRSS